jgi:hypothetical protein
MSQLILAHFNYAAGSSASNNRLLGANPQKGKEGKIIFDDNEDEDF